MPQNTGYKQTQISQIRKAFDMLSEAIGSLPDGDLKEELTSGITPLTELVESAPSSPDSPEDDMLDLSESNSEMDFGELSDMTPDMAGMQPEEKPAKKKRLGAMIEEDDAE